jgi:enolase-phosphatase E1
MKPVVLTDIEGTTSRIDFVHKVLFPYARARIADFVAAHRADPAVAAALAEVRAEIGGDATPAQETAALLGWIDEDRKIKPLKDLQGLIWDAGYKAGDFTAHLYVDAYDALRRWHAAGHRLNVYSSGSIAAQKLFFRHSVFGDLSPLIDDYFDTTSGSKREADSYRRIAASIGRAPGEIVFLSDIEAELDAARSAGLRTIQLVRSDAPPASSGAHPVVASMRDIDLRSEE